MKGRKKAEIIEDLERLATSKGYVYTLASLVFTELFFPQDEVATINWREKLSFQEITFLFGLMAKMPVDLDSISPETIQEQATKTIELFSELHLAHNIPILSKIVESASHHKENNYDAERMRIFGAGETMTEPIFYGGSGAYDFQYQEMAVDKYSNHNQWLKEKFGFEIQDAARMASETHTLVQAKMSSTKVEKPEDITCEIFLNALCVSPEDFEGINPAIAQCVLEAFSTSAPCNEGLELGSHNEVESSPFLKLSDGRYFLPVSFNFSKSVFESPFYWAGTENEVFFSKFSNSLGDQLEASAANLLEKVFGKNSVHRNVNVYKDGNKIGEIDCLATYLNKAIIVEAKSKKLTTLSKQGDTEKLKSDFNEGLQKAFHQGLIIKENLLSGCELYCEDKLIELAPIVDGAYIICLLGGHYPALLHQFDVYFKKPDDQDFPLPLSIFDLELMVEYLKTPIEFLYYINQRLKHIEIIKTGEEAAILAFHLRTKIYKKPAFDLEMIDDGFAQWVDADFPFRRGRFEGEPKEPLDCRWINENTVTLLRAIEDSQRATSEAMFRVLDASPMTTDDLMGRVNEMRGKSDIDGKIHSVSLTTDEGGYGISAIYLPSDESTTENHLKEFVLAKKYATKSGAWLGFAGASFSKRVISSAFYDESEWEPDPLMEEKVKTVLRPGTEMRTRKIGRNEPCYCGSGIKYKKCHGK